MITLLKSATVFDPVQGINGEVRDLWIEDGRFCQMPEGNRQPDRIIDMTGLIVMAGAIDMHTHIGGGKVNLARTMLPELQAGQRVARNAWGRGGTNGPVPSTWAAGYRYAEMGYTACFEPAILPVNARQAHLEMADTPIIDTGGYAMLGSEDLLLQMLHAKRPQQEFNDLVAWTLAATQCCGIKVVNAGGINAFKFNQRKLNVDQENARYGVTPRQIIEVLSRAMGELGVPHPLHVHCSNLGMPGNIDSTIATLEAAGEHRLHLTHVQFHSYGAGGVHGISSEAARLAEYINAHPQFSVDVGQIVFGQTATISGDTMLQYRQHPVAKPKKWSVMDIELEAGCGVVPFKYEQKQYVNALQWTIGLELLLLINDPWRVFLTTDHPNGGPFTSYPHLIALLMDKSLRQRVLQEIHPDAAAASQLSGIEREYSLYEIAILTRSAPAKILGITSIGHLSSGAQADVVAYRPSEDRQAMFTKPAWVLKNGSIVVRDGVVVGHAPKSTHVVRPQYEASHYKRTQEYFETYHTIGLEHLKISDDELEHSIGSAVKVHPCLHQRKA